MSSWSTAAFMPGRVIDQVTLGLGHFSSGVVRPASIAQTVVDGAK